MRHLAVYPFIARLVPLLLALVLVATWGDAVLRVLAPALQPDPATGLRWPTSAGWVAARLAASGQATQVYDAPAFRRASLQLGAYPDVFEPNLPPTALVYLTLAP